jgi:outer membrane protein
MKYLVASTLLIGLLTACGGGDEKKKEDSKQEITNVEVKSVGELTIGYYNLESIPTEFNFYKETQVRLEKKGAVIEQELMRWQQEGQKSQAALQKGAQSQTLTDNQAMAYQNTIRDCEMKIMEIQRNKLEPFQQESFELNQVLTNKIDAYGKEFSQKNGIKLFLSYSKGASVTYVDSTFDMTSQFIEYMNKEEAELNADIE